MKAEASTLVISELTVTSVDQVGPNHALLGETKHSQLPASQCGIINVSGIRHQIGFLK